MNLWLDKNTFAAGEKISVHYSGMAGNTQDWIALTQKDKPDNQYGVWKYTAGSKTGTLIFDPIAAGEYEARAYFNNGYQVEKRIFFSVGSSQGGTVTPVSGSRLKLDKGNFMEGEKIKVTYFNLPGNKQDWITIAVEGQTDNQYGQWFYTEGKNSGVIEFSGLSAGNYQVRLLFNNSYKVEERLSFKVTKNTEGDFIIKTAKTVYSEKESIGVLFANSQGTEVDWVTIVAAGKPDSEYGQWFHKGRLPSGELTFSPLPPGDYEIRYYLNNGYEVKKRLHIKVVK